MRLREVLGLPVICVTTGNKLGQVQDIIFHLDTGEIQGIVIVQKKLITKNKGILKENIVKVGSNAIFVKDEQCVLDEEKMTALKNTKRFVQEIVERDVYTDKGSKIGSVQDAQFDVEFGMLETIEISDGVAEDLLKGRKLVPVSESIQLDKGIVIIESSNINSITHNGKGLKKLFRKDEIK